MGENAVNTGKTWLYLYCDAVLKGDYDYEYWGNYRQPSTYTVSDDFLMVNFYLTHDEDWDFFNSWARKI